MISNIFSSEITVNCWFCNENSEIQKADKQSWTCSSCKQYNGFTEEGDYNKELSEQYNVKDYKTKTLCTPMDSGGVQSLLCESCSKNQVMKVRQLATFTPFHEVDYDQEVDMYKDYLEHLYSLCKTCEFKVRDYLYDQDSTLLSQLDETQHQKLANFSQRDITAIDSIQMSRHRSYKNVMAMIMLLHSSLCSLFIFIANLRLEASSMVISNGTLLSSYTARFSELLLEALPGQLTLDIRINIAFVGVFLCLCGLYIAGKYSFYPEDVIHLLLWLFTIVVLSVVDIPLLWNLCLNTCTLCTSFLCFARSRMPKNFTFLSIQRKELKKTISSDLSSCASETAESVATSDVSPSVNTLLPDLTDEPLQHFETVRQNLELVSLGLGRTKGSSSSIWSLPSIVASSPSPKISSSPSDLLPDSSSDLTLQKRGVLMPSRLGFLTYDPHLQSKGNILIFFLINIGK
ncbi:hypothetical protein Btru_030515 [Bulinus truncatus]|nr:hypothetical protein Btru_030515 [Bulinus truncatus]